MEPSDVFAVQVASLRKLYGKVVAVDRGRCENVPFEFKGCVGRSCSLSARLLFS